MYRERKSGAMRRGQKLTPDAIAFKHAVCIFARGDTLIPEGATKHELSKVRYEAEINIYLGPGQRLDGDNGGKCVFDGLEDAAVIHSDARVKTHKISVHGDQRHNPRTEIKVWRIEDEVKNSKRSFTKESDK